MRGVNVLLVTLTVFLVESSWAVSICSNPKQIYLTAQNGIIQTPNFPGKFKTPLCIHWLIDSQQPYTIFNETGNHFSNGKRIRIYLTQLYLQENLTFIGYIKYPYPNGETLDESEQNSVRRHVADTGFSRVPIPRYISEDGNSSSFVSAYATELRFLGIQLEIATPFPQHLRVSNFLHIYGFNITYNIADEKHHLEDFKNRESCSIRNCSFAGDCYVSSNYRRFSCSCHEGRYGEYCEYNQQTCNPRQNITFCRNGGSCKMQPSGVGVCYCPPGYSGQLCGLKLETVVKECPGPGCEEVCVIGSSSTRRPCSCHYGRNIPKGIGWMRFEVMLQALEQLPVRDFTSGGGPIPQADLKLKSDIEQSLKRKLDKVPGLDGIDTSVGIVSFGIASTIHFQYFGPNETMKNEKLIKEILTEGSLHPIQELSDTFKFNSYPALALTKLFKGGSSDLLKVGEPFDLHCEAQGSATLKFRWFKEGLPIDKTLATREINEQSYVFPKFVRESILMFPSSTLEDRGVFTCQVSDMGEEHCLEITVGVVAPPYILVEPLSLTLDKGDEEQVITCVSENENPKHNFSYTWAKNGKVIQNRGHWTNEVIEDLYPYGSLLRIMVAEVSAIYTCHVTNYAGWNETHVEVRVLDSQYLAFCPQRLDQYKIDWNRTAVGQLAKQVCPSGYSGYVQRLCDKSSAHNPTPQWGPSVFFKCLAKELRDLSKNLQILRMGFANKTQILKLTQKLCNYLATKTFLYNGEGETIIEVLEDFANYAIQKKEVIDKTDDQFLRQLLNATTYLLGFPASCARPSSVVRLGNLIKKIAIKFPTLSNPFIWESDLFLLEKLQISASPFFHPYRFPISRLDWTANFRLQIPNSANGSRANEGTLLVFVAYRNLTSIASPSRDQHKLLANRVASPIISIDTPKYALASALQFTFTVSENLAEEFHASKKNFTCGGLEASKNNEEISWTPNACSSNEIIRNRSVECSCEHFGQFALLVLDGEVPPALVVSVEIHWSVILGTVVLITGCGLAMICILIHIEFQFSSDSLYPLKLIVCSTLIFSQLFILSLRSETYSIGLSTTFCSLLVLCLSCQLVKPLAILTSEPVNLYCYLRPLSPLSLVLGFFVVFALPVWTGAMALTWKAQKHSTLELRPAHSHGTSLVTEDSPLFGVFAAIVGIIILGFVFFSFKAFLTLRRLRLQETAEKTNFAYYRIRVLSRSVIVTASILLMTVSGILHITIPESQIYQYLLGMTTLVTGVIVFLCYTVKSEYPIPYRLIHLLSSNSYQDLVDPEKFLTKRNSEDQVTQGRSPVKTFENGQASTILLPQNEYPMEDDDEGHRERATTFDSLTSDQLTISDTTMATIVGSSILSTSSGGRRDSFALRAWSGTDKRLSLGSANSKATSITRSLTNPVHSASSACRPLLHQHHCTGACRRDRKERSFSCGAGSCGPIKPDRGRCLLREIESADYVLPSNSEQSSQAQHSTSPASPTDLCPTTTGYMDIVNRPLLPEKTRDLSTFDPQFLQHPTRSGHEALYESIKYESLKELPGRLTLPKLDSHNGYRDITSMVNGSGANRGHIFKKTDPLPPTPIEFLSKVDFVTKSEPNVKGTLKSLDSFMENGNRRGGINGFHAMPVGTQSLR